MLNLMALGLHLLLTLASSENVARMEPKRNPGGIPITVRYHLFLYQPLFPSSAFFPGFRRAASGLHLLKVVCGAILLDKTEQSGGKRNGQFLDMHDQAPIGRNSITTNIEHFWCAMQR